MRFCIVSIESVISSTKSTLGERKNPLSRRKGEKNQFDSTIVKSAETALRPEAILLREYLPKNVTLGVVTKKSLEKYSTLIFEPKKSNEKIDSEKFVLPSITYESKRINFGRIDLKILNLRIRQITESKNSIKPDSF